MSKLKKIFLILIILVVLSIAYFIYWNLKDKNKKTIENSLTVENSIDYKKESKINNASFEIIQDSISAKGLSIVITDNNSQKIDWSTGYKIQALNGNEWQNIEMITNNIPYIPINYEFDENNKAKLELEWTDYYGELSKGKYCIVMNAFDSEANRETIYNIREFEIK